MIEDLRRLLWRFEAGYFLKELVRDHFEETRTDLLNRWRRANDTGIRFPDHDWIIQSRVQFEKTIAEAERANRQSDFGTALRSLERAEALLKDFTIVQEALIAISTASYKSAVLQNYLGVTVQGVNHLSLLCSMARSQFDENNYRCARLIALACCEAVDQLLAQSERDLETMDYLQFVKEQKKICDRMQAMLPQSTSVMLIRNIIAATERAVQERKVALARLLKDEIEELTAGASTFLGELDRQGLSEELVPMPVRSGSNQDIEIWRTATNFLISRRLQSLSQRVGEALTRATPPAAVSA